MNLLEARDLCKSFKAPHKLWQRAAQVSAVRQLSLQLKQGEVLGIIGESGCGKSTLARLLVGLLALDSGELLWAGKHPQSLSRQARAQWIQLIFQDPGSSLHPRLRVVDAIMEPIRCVRGLSKVKALHEIHQLLDLLDLPRELLARYPLELSGGQKQRVCLARALGLKPAIMVCDEPLTALDRITQSRVLELFANLRQELGLSMIFVSHDISTVRAIADRVAVMYEGQWLESGPTEQILVSPQHPYTRSLLQSLPKLYQQNPPQLSE